METEQVGCSDKLYSACIVDIEAKGKACGDRSEVVVVVVFVDETTKSAAVGDNLDELVYCVVENVSKMAACGDKTELATMLHFDALAKAIVTGIVDLVVGRVGVQYESGELMIVVLDLLYWM